jgi:hypothetical protein
MKCPKCGWEITKLYMTEIKEDRRSGVLDDEGYQDDFAPLQSNWEYMCGNHDCYAVLYEGGFMDVLEEVFEYIEDEQPTKEEKDAR